MSELERAEERLARLRRGFGRLTDAVESRFLGHEPAVEELLFALLAGGHVLLEGAPGLGKTTLVHTVASALGMLFRRIQFTPDLMPPDILGTRILEIDENGGRHFRFERGPLFANVVLADEVNRATPRTQSALLEAMQERQVTVFGESLVLEEPFFVIATQNPIEMEGTYPLPEAQLDRFLLKIELAAPSLDELVSILGATTGERPSGLDPVVERSEVLRLQELVREVPTGSDELLLASRLVLATHPENELAPEAVRRYVRYGASPRGGQALLMAGKARALAQGRLCVSAQDIERLAAPALRHRLILNYEGEASGVHPDELVREALAAVQRSHAVDP